MPWTCPGCGHTIQHDTEDMPRLDTVYRCHICRLELAVDPSLHKLRPLPSKGDDRKRRRSTR